MSVLDVLLFSFLQMFTVERPGAQATRFLDSYYSNLGNNENNRILGYNRY